MSDTRKFLDPDPELLSRALGEDQEATERLLASLRAPVHRLALSITGDPDGADDVTQESLIRAAAGLPELREAGAFPSWLYRIVRNAALDHEASRRRHRERTEPLEAARNRSGEANSPGVLQRIQDGRARALVEAYLDELPPRQRQVFDLVELGGYEPTEVAGLLELAPGSVRASLFKARRALRSRILSSHPELEEEYGP